MKVFISADLEGISGVVSMEEIFAGKPGYPAACKAMTGDVNAAIEGALEAGADEIVVFDAHSDGRNVDLDQLHSKARIIRGQPLPFMIAGLDETFAAVFLVGYHAKVGTAGGVMDHTYTARLNRVAINGREFGELGLAAAHAGSFAVPVALVSGDDKLREEAREFVPDALAAVVKTGLGRHSAECLSLGQARQAIREAAKQSLGRLNRMRPFTVRLPLTLEVEYPTTASVERAICLPGVERRGDRSIACTLDSVPELTGLLSVLAFLAL